MEGRIESIERKLRLAITDYEDAKEEELRVLNFINAYSLTKVKIS